MATRCGGGADATIGKRHAAGRPDASASGMVAPMPRRRLPAVLRAARRARSASAIALVLLLGACASVAPPSGRALPPTTGLESPERDGAPSASPPGLALVPDAEPRIEPIRPGGPNKPYEVLGRSYIPLTADRPVSERGMASWYGRKFHGRRTASGEVYDMYAMTAAHPTLPLPSYVRVRNPGNGREVVLRVNDRGPFHPGRIIDLSYTAALKLDLLRGVAPVEIERITFEDIRSGAWRRDGASVLAAAGPTAAAAAALAAVSTAAPAREAETGPAPGPPDASAVASATSVPQLDFVTARGEEAASMAAPPGRGFFVQLGAFSQREAAEGLQRQVGNELAWLAPALVIFGDAAVFRLQAGPYPSRDAARDVAERVRDGLRRVPMIVERR